MSPVGFMNLEPLIGDVLSIDRSLHREMAATYHRPQQIQTDGDRGRISRLSAFLRRAKHSGLTGKRAKSLKDAFKYILYRQESPLRRVYTSRVCCLF